VRVRVGVRAPWRWSWGRKSGGGGGGDGGSDDKRGMKREGSWETVMVGVKEVELVEPARTSTVQYASHEPNTSRHLTRRRLYDR
jgi:hypothetical protein